MRIKRIESKRLAFETAKAISALLEKEQDNDVLLMLAGGSSFAVYDAISPQWLSDHITIAMTDDRFSKEMDVSNSHQLQATDFYNECVSADAYYISSEVRDEQGPEELAKRFEYGLRKWVREFPDGTIIAVFGLGEDGHTAGMIPGGGMSDDEQKTFKQLFENTENWVTGYTTSNSKYHERISITIPFIKKYIKHAIVFISGENKRLALDNLLAENGDLNKTPARVLRELKDVQIFTDIAEK